MKRSALILTVLLGFASQALAVNYLQVGAPAPVTVPPAPSEGTYADYKDPLSGPTENDTARTSGSIIYAAGAYKGGVFDPADPKKGGYDLLIGGMYRGTYQPKASDSIKNWSDFGFTANQPDASNPFNSAGALIMATVKNDSLPATVGSLTINGNAPIYIANSYQNGFLVPSPPSNHAPVQTGDQFLFFDIGNFGTNESVPNFADETGSVAGEIMDLTINPSGYEWVHFDLFALVTSEDVSKNGVFTHLVSGTDDQGNPGSHDVTWIPGGGGGGQETPVPEPGTFVLLGSGLVALGLFGRRKLRK